MHAWIVARNQKCKPKCNGNHLRRKQNSQVPTTFRGFKLLPRNILRRWDWCCNLFGALLNVVGCEPSPPKSKERGEDPTLEMYKGEEQASGWFLKFIYIHLDKLRHWSWAALWTPWLHYANFLHLLSLPHMHCSVCARHYLLQRPRCT